MSEDISGYMDEHDLLALIQAKEPDFVAPVIDFNSNKQKSGSNRPFNDNPPDDLFAPDAATDSATDNIKDFTEAKVSKIIPLNLADIEQYEAKPPEYVCEPFLETQGICLVYAATGVGKTMFTLNIAYAIASGGAFLKYACPKARKVLYIDGEMKLSQLVSRLKKIAVTQGGCDFDDNLGIITPDELQKAGLSTLKVDNRDDQAIYDKIIDKYGYEVIIIDNFSVLTSLDENKSNEWMVVVNWLLSLRRRGKTVIGVHHAGKDKSGYRGSSRLLDCVDTAISLQAVNSDQIEDNEDAAQRFKIVYQKARAFGGKDRATYEVTLADEIFSYRSIEVCTLDKIRECLDANMSQREIAKELLISQTTVHRLIKKARLLIR